VSEAALPPAAPRRAGAIPVDSRQARLMIVGSLMLLAFSFLLAAGLRGHSPKAVLAALDERGIAVDERIARLPLPVRRSLLCVALNVLMEARGEPNAGQIGVAWVTRTRADERDLSPCEVVFEPAQFSWTSYPLSRIVRTATANQETLLEAQDWAWKVMVENVPDPTKGANHFWAHRMIRPPLWARRAIPGTRVVIGGHTFARIAARRFPWIGQP
jgi:N-acetylmuramoyl-L-alanine amidase